MKYFLLFGAFILLFIGSISAQKNHTISGYVKEEATGESLLGANVFVKETMKGTVTNQYGFFSLTIPEGNYTLVFSYIGFVSQEFPISLTEDLRKSTSLKSNAIETKEVVITGEKQDRNVQSTEMGREKIEIEKIKTLPAFMGEVDILKTIQLLPGVSSAGEGNSGFYVRGGGPDQNLILLDEANV